MDNHHSFVIRPACAPFPHYNINEWKQKATLGILNPLKLFHVI